ncbi:MAG: tagaturonate epimerase family protein [bacterium]
MTKDQILKALTKSYKSNQIVPLVLSPNFQFELYPKSINRLQDAFVFLARHENGKFLYIYAEDKANLILSRFQGEFAPLDSERSGWLKRCPMTHDNAEQVRAQFAFARPVLIGLENSFGMGDRLGIANPAHLRAIMATDMKPILAQQSIRELQRTQRKPEQVMDAATWAVLQEGYKSGFGADADHLKTTDNIDLMAAAGFTMFTFDPGDHVVNEADTLTFEQLKAQINNLPWELLNDSPENFIRRYENQQFKIGADFNLKPNEEQVYRALVKYGGVIAHTNKLFQYLKERYPAHPAELELSVDETDSVTSPFEHFLIASELRRLEIPLVSLAPRFVGDFEKGIDYKGNLSEFRSEYLKHLMIAEKMGPYKISIHSGSDKFRVYEVIGELEQGRVHVKTAGTSYLEALHTVAAVQPNLFREILDFSREHFESEKASYHISASLDKVLPANQYTDVQLLKLFEQEDARQVLHVTFGKVLTSQNDRREYLFRQRILSCLNAHEETHYRFLIRHFERHLLPFKKRNS